MSLERNLEDVFGDRVVQILKDSASAIGISFTTIVLMVLAGLIISVIVSLLRIAINYFDFSLAETPLGFRLKAGLINTRQFIVPFSRIQYISWNANWIRRKIGMYNLEFHEVAGEHVKKKLKLTVPVTRESFIKKILFHYHEQIAAAAHSVHAIHRSFPFRRMLLLAILPVALVLLASQVPGWNLVLWPVVLWIPYVFINAVFFRKNFRLYVTPDAVQIKSGVWGRKVEIIKWHKIQKVILQQSIYQRHKKLASLHLITAGGRIHIPYVTLELARLIQNYALYEVERSERPWM